MVVKVCVYILDGEPETFAQVQTRHMQTKLFCKIDGVAFLSRSEVRAEIVYSIQSCASLCTKDISCLSANYRASTGNCTLINDLDHSLEEEFVRGADYAHLTTRVCN